ncbi:hypothetical protein MMC08_008941 [Hypocenomyce scalaris]|nr:hypothetical protein [Hypocenomyce scalaris]
MTALSDGTYLTLNGPTHGVASFGLASGPNLNASLYDPRLPVNSRFSIMASTIVARLYHSEAILHARQARHGLGLRSPRRRAPGRNTASNPSTRPACSPAFEQPDFTITNTDWTCGETVTIGVTSYQGPISNYSVSLMGAATSTHGNSMG